MKCDRCRLYQAPAGEPLRSFPRTPSPLSQVASHQIGTIRVKGVAFCKGKKLVNGSTSAPKRAHSFAALDSSGPALLAAAAVCSF